MPIVCLPATLSTPEILFDPERHQLDIRGSCHSANPQALFAPLLARLDGHFRQHQPSWFTLNLQLQYVDRPAAQALRGLLAMLAAQGRMGRWIELVWQAEADDSAMTQLADCLLDGLGDIEVVHATSLQ